MNLILDAHAFIWFINGDNSLPVKLKNEISNISNKCFLSIATIWEIAIKASLKKLELKGGFDMIPEFLTGK